MPANSSLTTASKEKARRFSTWRPPMASPLFSNPFAEDRLTGASGYSAALDVPSLNQVVSDSLLEVIQRASRSRTVESRRKIFVLKAPPGYGKTHLMGRIGHHC